MNDDRAIPSHLCGWVVLRRGDKVLLARRSGVSYGDGLWGLPGGHADADETWAAAAARETLEEVGVTVELAQLTLLGLGRYLEDGVHGIDAFFLATEWGGEPAAISECSEVGWFEVNDLPLDSLPWLADALPYHLGGGHWLYEDL